MIKAAITISCYCLLSVFFFIPDPKWFAPVSCRCLNDDESSVVASLFAFGVFGKVLPIISGATSK